MEIIDDSISGMDIDKSHSIFYLSEHIAT